MYLINKLEEIMQKEKIDQVVSIATAVIPLVVKKGSENLIIIAKNVGELLKLYLVK